MSKYRYALRFAELVHRGQTRKFSGEPYFLHCVRVSATVGEIFGKESPDSLAGLGHDIIEDCNLSQEQLQEMVSIFGEEAMSIIREVTNVSGNPEFAKLSRAERKAADFAKIARASTNAKILKAADRIDNLEEIEKAPEKWRNLYIGESIQLFEILKNHIPTHLARRFSAIIDANK